MGLGKLGDRDQAYGHHSPCTYAPSFVIPAATSRARPLMSLTMLSTAS